MEVGRADTGSDHEHPSTATEETYVILNLLTRDEGQGLAEYALILALIAIIAIVALIFLGGAISGILHNVGSSV
jgi:pilus assembly protein Flp/PilA